MSEPLLSGGEVLQYGPEFNLSRDRQGVWRGTQNMWLRKENLASGAPAVGTAHPEYTFLFLDTLEVSHDGGEMLELVGSYVGANLVNGDVLDVVPEYALDVQLAEEPIETDPYYTDTLSAAQILKAKRLAENPKLNDDNEPEAPDTTGWPAKQVQLYDDLSNGLQAVRDPRVTWTESKLYSALPSLGDIGEIDTPPGPVPTVASGRNWLLSGYSARVKAGDLFWEVNRTWDLSGRGGWDTRFYS